MADQSTKSTQGGTHDQHVKAGEQSHKNNPASGSSEQSPSEHKGTQGGSHEQHVKAGEQSHKKS